jgi:hypothetical protein
MTNMSLSQLEKNTGGVLQFGADTSQQAHLGSHVGKVGYRCCQQTQILLNCRSVVLTMDDVLEYHEEKGKRIIQKLPVSIN